MTDNNEVLLRLAKLERSSKSAIPFGIFAMLAISGALYFGSKELRDTRQKIHSAQAQLAVMRQQMGSEQKELQDKENVIALKMVAIDEAQKQLDAVRAEIAALSNERNNPDAIRIRSALAGVARADASLAVAGGTTGVDPATTLKLRYGSMNVDIFYCESSLSSSAELAKRVDALGRRNTAGRWRLRPLSADVNDNPGYRLNSDVIRYNADEKRVAETLARDIADKFDAEMTLQQIDYPTPGYISVFACKSDRQTKPDVRRIVR